MDNMKMTDVGNGMVKLEYLDYCEDLNFERTLINITMKMLESQLIRESNNFKQKNAEDSINFRKLGNKIYSSKSHNTDTHYLIWKLYSQSIALAPNNSEELAIAYSNRSALLFHLKKYEDCIKDCDQAMKIVAVSDFIKVKALYRKIECLVALKEDVVKSTCENVLALIKKFNLNPEIKKNFIQKIEDILSTVSSISFKKNRIDQEEPKLPAFTHQTEIPCASTAVAIKNDKRWGRHIVATRKIEPGEILVLEKSYVTCIDNEIYSFCFNCKKQIWSSIPCDTCMYSMYCTEKCKIEAWKKYHQFECPVLCYIYNINIGKYPHLSEHETEKGKKLMKALRLALRLILLSTYEASGIENLRSELISLAECKDPLKKGFSSDGILHSTKLKSIFSLNTIRDDLGFDEMSELTTITCIAIYHLVKYSNFFKLKKTELLPSLMLFNDNIQFIGGLLLRALHVIKINAVDVKYYSKGDDYPLKNQVHGVSLNSFSSLFRHSCNPNVKNIFTKKNERMIYATCVIEEGEQLYLCYVGDDYTSYSKIDRHQILSNKYCFDCKCIACKEDWPCILRSIKDIIQNCCELQYPLERKYKNLIPLKNKIIKNLKENNFHYDSNTMTDLRKLMIEHYENFTLRSTDYKALEKYMHRMFINGFGILMDIPEKC